MSKKILIVGPSWVGDMIMAQTLFKLLAKRYPGAQIDVLAPKWSYPILERIPEVNKKFCLELTHGELGLSKRWNVAKELRRENYDQAIVLANSWKSALIPWFAKIPVRTGWLGEFRWGLLNDTRKLDKKSLPKMVQRYAALAFKKDAELPNELPVPELMADPKEIPETPVLALCPGAAYGPAKRWPELYYAAVATEKIKQGWDVWIFGSNADKEVIENIQSKVAGETRSFAGKINLMQTIDLFSVVSAVVTNDSGLMHLAASLDKPLVAIYGSTSPEFTPPLGSKSKILKIDISCSPCFKRECPLGHMKCMWDIDPESVIQALDSLES